jgi:hypothetical protein
MRRARPHLPPAMLAGLAVLLTGCAGFSPDGGMSAVPLPSSAPAMYSDIAGGGAFEFERAIVLSILPLAF